jgi:hypothetical protein
MNDIDFIAGALFGIGGTMFWLYAAFSNSGLVARRAYRRGHAHGLAQATLPPYLQDLSK